MGGHIRGRRSLMACALVAAAISVGGAEASSLDEIVLPPSVPGAHISNGTVKLGVNNLGQLNFYVEPQLVGVMYVPTGNDGTRAGCQCEGWGAGARATGETAHIFQGRANNAAGINGVSLVSFAADAATATSVVDVPNGQLPGLRVTHEFVPSDRTPNLYRIAITIKNVSEGPLSDVRYSREMDWDVEPTQFQEFVTINRGGPPAALVYSDDNGFADNYPFSLGEVAVGEVREGNTDLPEIQEVELDATGGTFRLSLDDGETWTSHLAYDASAAEVETALELLCECALNVSRSDNVYAIEWTAAGDQPEIRGDAANLSTAPDAGDDSTANASYVDKGPDDHGARFIFGFGDLAAGEQATFFLFYGAAGTEVAADEAARAAALEIFSYGQPSGEGGAANGVPNTFIFGFSGVGGAPVIPQVVEDGSADVGVTISASSESVDPGQQVSFAVVATNHGPFRAPGTNVTVHLPANFSFASVSTSKGTCNGGAPTTCSLDTLAVGESASIGVVATASTPGPGTAQADVSSAAADPNVGANNSATAGVTVAGEIEEEGEQPPPEPGEGNATPLRGTVTINGREVEGEVRLQNGDTVDTTEGTIELETVNGTAQFAGGEFRYFDLSSAASVLRRASAGTEELSVTEIRLSGGDFRRTCATGSRKLSANGAEPPKKKTKVRSLWGNADGSFRTRGRHSSATIRGTVWLTADRCDGTLTFVREGSVLVEDFRLKRTRIIETGERYLAKPQAKSKSKSKRR